MRLTECMGCQIGDHSKHYRVVQAVPEGMFGGAVCDCKGECEDNKEEKRKRFLRRTGLTLWPRK